MDFTADENKILNQAIKFKDKPLRFSNNKGRYMIVFICLILMILGGIHHLLSDFSEGLKSLGFILIFFAYIWSVTSLNKFTRNSFSLIRKLYNRSENH